MVAALSSILMLQTNTRNGSVVLDFYKLQLDYLFPDVLYFRGTTEIDIACLFSLPHVQGVDSMKCTTG